MVKVGKWLDGVTGHCYRLDVTCAVPEIAVCPPGSQNRPREDLETV